MPAAEDNVEAGLDWLFRHTDPGHPLIAELRRLARARLLRQLGGSALHGR